MNNPSTDILTLKNFLTALALDGTCNREREREIHYVHSASLAYEDGIVFMSEPSAVRQ